MQHPIVAEAEQKMRKAVEVMQNEFRVVRTGRASPALVENVKVEYYGTPTPLKQLAAISAPEANLLIIKPYDPSALAAMEKAVLKADLGLNPQNDGKVLRIAVPALSEERRKQMVGLVRDIAEKARIAVRNVRRDANKAAEDAEREKKISEDDKFRIRDEIQKFTDQYEAQIRDLMEKKSREIMEV
jgi:ribosome recycling factor